MADQKVLELERLDRFLEACKNSQDYPFTLLNGPLPKSLFEHYSKLLEKRKSSLLHPTRSLISLWEICDGEHAFRPECLIDTMDSLEARVKNIQADPRCRHVFIGSESSRSGLECSELLLKKLLTFHQVDPYFLDNLLAFGKYANMEPRDPIRCSFKNHNTGVSRSDLAPLPSLGRSGREIRHSFVLRSVEPVLGGSLLWPWRIRPVAVYHSFDLVSGKMVWITAKGNDVIKKDIMDTCVSFPGFAPEADITGAFQATLDTHLIYSNWCSLNWQWFIRDADDQIREKFAKARRYPVGRVAYSTTFPVARTGTSPTTGDFSAGEHRRRKNNPFISLLRHWDSNRTDVTDADVPPPEKSEAEELNNEAHFLGMFSHKDLQTLTVVQQRLDEARGVLELNQEVLRRLSEYYRNIAQCFPSNMDPQTLNAIDGSIKRFTLGINEVVEDLGENERVLMVSRTKLEQGDKPMLEHTLQLRGSHADRMFAAEAHKSSIANQDIADSTKRLTHLMYILTFILCCVLPASVALAFLQSGIIGWGDSQGFRLTPFSFFLGLTVLGTAIFLIWWHIKTRPRKKTEAV